MRITGITAYTGSTLGSNNNVNFGKFADQNADNKMKELLVDAPQWNPDMLYNMVKEEPSIIIRTEKDGTLQGELDNEYMEANAEKLKKVTYAYDLIAEWELLKNLHIKDKAHELAEIIKRIQEGLDGTTDRIKLLYPANSEQDTFTPQQLEEFEIRDKLLHLAQ